MKKVMCVLLSLFFVFAWGACKSSQAIDAEHNSKNSLNWAGVYTGTIPAADGPGINVTISLNTGGTYEARYQYIERPGSDFTLKGTFVWDNTGNIIKLNTKDIPPYYKVGENRLIQLDMRGKPITGNLADMYVLGKTP
jgi:uncharacterized lipoprotein NlpE involved in copper resistance